MPDATNTNATTSANSVMNDQRIVASSTSWSCATCAIRFDIQADQRRHMKEPWHVYNLKRRIVDLPAVAREVFETENQQSKAARLELQSLLSQDNLDDEASSSDESCSPTPYQCLFCSVGFEPTDEGLTADVRHLITAHDFLIPDHDTMIDMHSFIGYLANVVREWHECLSCGAIRYSTAAIQSHMRDRGHCQLNFDREPELHQFWDDTPSPARPSLVSTASHLTGPAESEVSLPSGRLIGSKTTFSQATRSQTRHTTALVVASSSSSSATEDREPPVPPSRSRISNDRQLARRDEQGVLGISVQQRGALIIAQQTAQRSEAAARRAKEWINNRSSNTQKTDQMDTTKIGKRGKQTHKLLPR